MIRARDIARSLEWYTSVGFREIARYGEEGALNFGMVSFGKAELMFMPGEPVHDAVRLWFYTDAIHPIYETLKSRQLDAARAALAGGPPARHPIDFDEDLYRPFYGGVQFSIRDPDGYSLIFLQEE
jgi:catechol 2,3-dioxygenase-like lactoylglutathione lyase family enzyme